MHQNVRNCLIMLLVVGVVFFPQVAMAQISRQPASQWRSSPYLSEFHIVIPRDASPTLERAGGAFKRLWETHTRRPITMSAVNEGSTNVWLGADLITEDMLAPGIIAGLTPEEYLIRTFTPPRRDAARGAEKQLLIVGGSDLGVLNGVYAFFFDVANVAWFAPDVVNVPHPLRGMDECDLRGRPEFLWREIAVLGEQPGDVEEFRRAHHLPMTPHSTPGAPDYYSSFVRGVSNEVNMEDRAIVQYGADAGAQRLTEEILALMTAEENEENRTLIEKRNVAHWQKDGETVWLLAAMRWLTPALSPEGAALNLSEQSPAAAIVATASAVARELEERYPSHRHRVLVLLSPEIQQAPRSLRPHRNVIVQLSTRECNFATPLTNRDCPMNTRFVETLQAWLNLRATVHILDHSCNMRHPSLPFPSFEVLRPNLLFYAGRMLEGVYFASPGETNTAPFVSLHLFLTASLLRNPDMATDSLKYDFLNAFYGAAAPTVASCIDALEEELRHSKLPLTPDDDAQWLSRETLAQLHTSLVDALTANLEDNARKRIESLCNAFHLAIESRETL